MPWQGSQGGKIGMGGKSAWVTTGHASSGKNRLAAKRGTHRAEASVA
jgi:hypothetical protein